ncbi:uncharacterized protein LOC135819804 isoform X2 [Sycon ciliatum]|uniref:uncharacterized protein LOC135819804 isoform X2 n=1 Tax=Sycon ciliatum TaxID=27933 RepID=UPI0031F661EE
MPSAWESKVFKGLTSTMIRTFTADDLRRKCASQSLITQSQKTKFAVLVGAAMQNEALLDAVRSGDDRSFHLFLECIREVEPEANVRAILEKLDQIDKYRAAAAAPQAAEPDASPISKPPAAPRKPCPDPFGDQRFFSNHMLWIATLNADAFRVNIQAFGLLTMADLSDLQLKQTNGGNSAHNYHVISLIRPGGNVAYKLLCQAIYSMNPILHTAKFNEMILLLPESQRPAIANAPVTRDLCEVLDEATLNSTMTRVRRIRISLIGQFGSGKTSLADSLKGKKFRPDKSSTPFLDVHPHGLLLRDGKLQEWEFSTAHLQGSRFIRDAETRTADRLRQNDAKRNAYQAEALEVRMEVESNTPISGGQEKLESKILDDPEPISAGELTQGVINEILDNRELTRDMGDEEVIMSMCDCGGQSIFSSLQQFMLSDSFVIYILCFNSAEGLCLIKDQTFTPEDTGVPEKIEVAKELENIDHIRHWLTAVHFASTADSEQDNVSYSPIIMVGNFADKLDPDLSLQQHKDKIWNNLCKLCCRSPVFAAMQSNSDGISTCDANSLFLVNNRESNASPEVRQIHAKIEEAMSIVLKGKVMRKSWVRFEWIVQHLNQAKKEKGCTSREWMKTMVAEACGIKEEVEFEELLQFYHCMRVIIYKPSKYPPPPDDLIVYNVQWLIKQINRFMFGKKYLVHEAGHTFEKKSLWEEETAARLHNTLWEKGTASMRLADITMASIPQSVRTKVIDVMVDWDLLYKLEDNSYLVPSALHQQSPPKIEGALRSFSKVDVEMDSINFSTADTPLLIAVEPSNAVQEDYEFPVPATPMPHSSYFKLLVRLFKKWDIRSINTSHCELTYNTARIRLPNRCLGLGEFKDGHVEIFMAHYESSGALLVSLNFQHPLHTFQPGHISTADKRLRSISSICQQVCKDIVSQLTELSFITTSSVSLDAGNLVCECKPSEWSDHTTRCRDLGYAPWRVRFAKQSTDIAAAEQSTGVAARSHVMEAAYPDGNPCIKCGKDIRVPNNSHCWFNDREFKLEGQSNQPARKKVAASNPLPCTPADPFKSKIFKKDILPRLREFDCGTLRRLLQDEGLLSLSEVLDLQRQEKYHGQEQANTAAINCAHAGGDDAYATMCRAVEKRPLLVELHKRMVALLPAQHGDSAQSEDSVDDVSQLPPGEESVAMTSITDALVVHTASVVSDLPAMASPAEKSSPEQPTSAAIRSIAVEPCSYMVTRDTPGTANQSSSLDSSSATLSSGHTVKAPSGRWQKGQDLTCQRLAMMGGVGRAERETAAGTDNTTAGSEQLSRHTVAPGPAGHTLPEDYEGKKSKKSKKDKKEKKSKKEKKEKKKSKDKERDLDEDEHARRQGNSERPPRDRDSRRDNSLNPSPGGDKQSSHVMQRQADRASKSAFSSPPRRHHSGSRSPRRQDRVQTQSRHRRGPSPPSHRRRSRSRSPSSSTRGQGRNASPPGQRGQRRSPMMRRRRQPSSSPERAERRRERRDRSRSPRRQQPQHRAASPDRRTATSHHRSAVHDSARSRSPVREARRSRSPMRNTRRDRSPESNSRRHAYSPVRSRKRRRRRRQPSSSPERAERRRERRDRSRSPRRQQPQHRAASPDRRTATSHHRSAVHDSARSRSPVREARRSRSPMRNTRRDRSPESNSRRHAYSPVRSRKRSRSPVRRSRRSHSPEDPHSSRNRRN